MTRRTLTRRALLGSAALAPLLVACATHDAMPQVDPSAPTYGTLRIGYGGPRVCSGPAKGRLHRRIG